MKFTTLGVEIAADRSRTWIALAGMNDEGRAVVDLLDPVDGTDAAPTLVALRDEHKIRQVAIDPRSNAATLLAPLEAAGVTLLRLDSSAMAVAFGRFLDWTVGGKLRHRGHPALTDAVRDAAARRTSAGSRVVDRGARVDPAPFVAAELAVYGIDEGADYDVMQSAW